MKMPPVSPQKPSVPSGQGTTAAGNQTNTVANGNATVTATNNANGSASGPTANNNNGNATGTNGQLAIVNNVNLIQPGNAGAPQPGSGRPPSPPAQGFRPNRAEYDTITTLRNRFEEFDANRDNTLSPEELARIPTRLVNGLDPKALGNIAFNMNNLIFASPEDPTAPAWFGVTRQDLDRMGTNSWNGMSIVQMSQTYRQETIQARGLNGDQGFLEHVFGYQQLARVAPALFG